MDEISASFVIRGGLEYWIRRSLDDCVICCGLGQLNGYAASVECGAACFGLGSHERPDRDVGDIRTPILLTAA